jgi:protein HOOK3
MSDAQRQELSAFLSFLATFDLARPVTAPSDLSDGAALLEVLSLVYVYAAVHHKLFTHEETT